MLQIESASHSQNRAVVSKSGAFRANGSFTSRDCKHGLFTSMVSDDEVVVLQVLGVGVPRILLDLFNGGRIARAVVGSPKVEGIPAFMQLAA